MRAALKCPSAPGVRRSTLSRLAVALNPPRSSTAWSGVMPARRGMYPRRQNLTADVYPLLAELGDDHRHLGVAQVRRGAFDDHALELGRRMPHGVDLARRDERDAAVGPHRHLLVHLGLECEAHVQLVAQLNAVGRPR